MGLDMYLSKHTYVKNWDHNKEKFVVNVTKNGETVTSIRPERVSYVIEEVAYWRKFNALHQWFVHNCAEDVDDCKEVYVSVKQLEKLLNILERVQEDHSLAKTLLPPQAGFFFGSTEIDEYYWQDLDTTVTLLRDIVEEANEQEPRTSSDYYYRASW